MHSIKGGAADVRVSFLQMEGGALPPSLSLAKELSGEGRPLFFVWSATSAHTTHSRQEQRERARLDFFGGPASVTRSTESNLIDAESRSI